MKKTIMVLSLFFISACFLSAVDLSGDLNSPYSNTKTYKTGGYGESAYKRKCDRCAVQ
jgi:hypothetical protein